MFKNARQQNQIKTILWIVFWVGVLIVLARFGAG